MPLRSRTGCGGYNYGYYLQDNSVIQRANNTGTILAYDNSFYNNVTADNGNGTAWTSGGCRSNMTSWMNYGNPSSGCEQGDNEQLSSGAGYSSTICNSSYCGSGNRPSFILSSNDMQSPDFTLSELSNSFFQTVTYRGAFNTSTDWTSNWTDWCPSSTVYCEGMRPARMNETGLQFVPNPSSGTTYVLFNTQSTGKVTISILDKVSGKVLRSTSSQVTEPGNQRIAFNVSGLQAGVYLVKVQTAAAIINGQLMVK